MNNLVLITIVSVLILKFSYDYKMKENFETPERIALDFSEKISQLDDDDRNQVETAICSATQQKNVARTLPSSLVTYRNFDQYRDDYFLKIESGNSYINKLKEIEEKFFKAKYGENIYNKLLNIRDEGEKVVINRMAEKYGLILNESSENPITSRSYGEIIANIERMINLNNYLQTISSSDVIDSLNSSKKYIDNEIRSLLGTTQTNNRKIELRGYEKIKLHSISFWLTIIYFIVLVYLFYSVMLTKPMSIGKGILSFVFLALVPTYIIPFAYKLLFKLSIFLHSKLEKNIHGPKNAFIDMKLNVKGDNYNI
jgi:hypothetical protein